MHNRFLILSICLATQTSFHCAVSQDDSPPREAKEEIELSAMPSQLTVTTWNDMPFSGLEMKDGKWIGKGYAFYLLDLISKKLNFTYTILPPKEHMLGDERHGILGLLYEKKVDLAVAFLPVLPEMRRYCSFSTALDETRLTALMKRPQESATGSGLLAPFNRTVWLLVLGAVLFVGPVIYIFALIRAKLWNDSESENYTLPSCTWFVYSSLLKQGTNIIAVTDTTRILFATWWIFILILTSFYTANLTAFLTKPQFTLSINSLQDIIKGGYSWMTYKGRLVDFLFSQAEYNELAGLNSSHSRSRGSYRYNEPTNDILKSVTTDRLFLAEAHYLQTLIFEDFLIKTRKQLEHELRCTYVIMPGSIYICNRAFGFPLDSKIEKFINKELLKLVETGIIEHTKEKDLPLAEICPVDLRSSERRLKNADLLLTYKVIGAGYAVATLVFLIEVVIRLVKRIYTQEQESVSTDNKTKNSIRIHNSNELPIEKQAEFFKQNSSLFHQSTLDSKQKKKQYINGRDYYIVIGNNGDQRLIPIRAPSAFLFQYAA